MVRKCKTERSAKRQKLIQDSLLALMHSHRYEEIPVSAICVQAGIPRRTFYNHFDSKDEVLDSVLEDLMLEINLESMFDFSQGVETMERSFTCFFQYWEGENHRMLDLLLKNDLTPRLMLWAQKWTQREQIGFPRPEEISPELVEIGTLWGSSGFFSALTYWAQNGYRQSPEDMAKYAVWLLSNPLYRK